nr:zinc finger, CCHC-type [Tanacetum cinerariifolium]
MGDANPIRTLGYYSKPSHEGYRNTIELPVGSITTWEDLTTRFLAQFFPPERTAKLRNDIMMFQQHHGESLYEAWTHFKDLLPKFPHHGIDLWLQVQIFYDHVNPVTRQTINQSADGKLRDRNAKESWALLEDIALYDNEKPEQAFAEYASSHTDEAGGPTKDDEGIEWLDVKEAQDLVDISEESIYESLIKEMPKCSLNYDFKIKKGDPRNLKIPCMIEITFQTPYKDLERCELSSEGHDLLSSRVILSKDDYDRGCRKPSDLQLGFYRDTIKLGPTYVTGIDNEGEVT